METGTIIAIVLLGLLIFALIRYEKPLGLILIELNDDLQMKYALCRGHKDEQSTAFAAKTASEIQEKIRRNLYRVIPCEIAYVIMISYSVYTKSYFLGIVLLAYTYFTTIFNFHVQRILRKFAKKFKRIPPT